MKKKSLKLQLVLGGGNGGNNRIWLVKLIYNKKWIVIIFHIIYIAVIIKNNFWRGQ